MLDVVMTSGSALSKLEVEVKRVYSISSMSMCHVVAVEFTRRSSRENKHIVETTEL
jgi:hypothetical protein